MSLSFRTLAIAVGVLGIAMGVAFGAGVAYGRGDPKTVQSGLTQQQIQQLYGAPTGGAGAAAGAAGGTNAGAGAAGGAAVAAAARATTGRVTAVSGQTVTIETARGSQKVNLAPSATVNKTAAAAATDITEGSTIFASGTRNQDGSFDATAISQVPAELATFIASLQGGGAGSGMPGGAPAASPTPPR
jgi:hypothetical protein